MHKIVIEFTALFLLINLISGCAATMGGSRCTPDMIRAGFFCYGGINFGKDLTPMQKKGITDGCRTGQGYFFKDYSLFESSKEYRVGWLKGRRVCRPNYNDNYMNETQRGVVPVDDSEVATP